ncbi:MAG: TatD family deoxyribonuclease [Desulfobacteraceae bacterium]|nr:MAG: TatD family deoxyribonuclease [Desulfobacteraceae bacterium]
MKLFDSHCHIDDKIFDPDFAQVLQRARNAGVQGMMIAGITLKTAEKAVPLAASNHGLFAAVGVHPHDAASCSETVIHRLQMLAGNPKVKAWGEIGLDFNRMFSPQEVQEKWFVRQLETADELQLPLIFHERESHGRLLSFLQETHTQNRTGVVHCFSGSRKELEAYLELGYYIGITGILTIQTRGTDLRKLVRHIPLDRLLIETDAPYLTPAPEKNKTHRNEPAFVRSTFEKLAETLNEPPEKLSEILWGNTCRLFKVHPHELD